MFVNVLFVFIVVLQAETLKLHKCAVGLNINKDISRDVTKPFDDHMIFNYLPSTSCNYIQAKPYDFNRNIPKTLPGGFTIHQLKYQLLWLYSIF